MEMRQFEFSLKMVEILFDIVCKNDQGILVLQAGCIKYLATWG